MFPQIKGGSEKGGYQFLENGGDRRSSVSTFQDWYTPFLLSPSSQGTGGPTVTQVSCFKLHAKRQNDDAVLPEHFQQKINIYTINKFFDNMIKYFTC